MRSPFEMNPYLRRDEVTKWTLRNDDVDATLKHGIVTHNVNDGRFGCVKAQAGVNATGSSALWYALQDVQPGKKTQFFRMGIISVATGATPVRSPVYLSDTTPGAITFTAPSVPIVVGEVIAQDEVLLNMNGSGGAGNPTPLDQYEFWVNGTAGDLRNRQFATIADAITQATNDVPLGGTAVINLAPGTTLTCPVTTLSGRDWVFRGGVVVVTGLTLDAGADIRFEDCTINGTLTAGNGCRVAFHRCTFVLAVVNVNTGTSTVTSYADVYNSVGTLKVTQTNVVTSAVLTYVAYNSDLWTTSSSTYLVDITKGSAEFTACRLKADGGVTAAPIRFDTTTANFGAQLIDCDVFLPDAALAVDASGPASPGVVTVRSGRLVVDSIGEPLITEGIPLMVVGDRSGAAAGELLTDSRRPTYEAGRSVAVYSTAVKALLGHLPVVEYVFAQAGDGEAHDGELATVSGVTELTVPDGEIWRCTVYRTGRNGTTIFADKRHFVVRNNAGTVTINASSAVDPEPAGTQVGSSNIVAGATAGTIKVQSTTASGWFVHATLVVEDAQNKGAW